MDLLLLPRPLFQRTDGQAVFHQGRVRPAFALSGPLGCAPRVLTGLLLSSLLRFSSVIGVAGVARVVLHVLGRT